MNPARVLGALLLLLLPALLPWGPQGLGATPREVAAGGAAVVALPADLRGLDPGEVMDRTSWRVLSCVFETLVRPGPEPGQVLPALAASWTSSGNGREWVLELRRGVRFHDGEPLTASAAANSLRRFSDPGPRRGRGTFFRCLLGGPTPVVQHVRALDSHSLQIVLREPTPGFLEVLAHPPMAIVAPSMVAPGAGEARPVGTGPFRFVERRSGQRVTLESNPQYWGGAPALDHLVFTVVPRASARQRELARGNADMALAVDLLAVDELKKSGTFRLAPAGGLNSWSLVMNCSRNPWSDIRTRLALQHALPRAVLARNLAGSRMAPATGVLSPRSWAFDETERGYAWRPERARRLLSRVRMPSSEPVLLLYPAESPVLADPGALARKIAEGLTKVGLPVRPRALPPAEFTDCLRRGAYDLALQLEEKGMVDPDLDLYPAWSRENRFPGGTNVSRFSSGRLQDLLVMARSIGEPEHRLRLYGEIQQQLWKAAPTVPLAWSLEVNAWRQELEGVTVDRLGIQDYSRAGLVPR